MQKKWSQTVFGLKNQRSGYILCLKINEVWEHLLFYPYVTPWGHFFCTYPCTWYSLNEKLYKIQGKWLPLYIPCISSCRLPLWDKPKRNLYLSDAFHSPGSESIRKWTLHEMFTITARKITLLNTIYQLLMKGEVQSKFVMIWLTKKVLWFPVMRPTHIKIPWLKTFLGFPDKTGIYLHSLCIHEEKFRGQKILQTRPERLDWLVPG